MTKIELIQLGDTYPVDFQKIQKFGYESTIFKIETISENNNSAILNRDTVRLSDVDFNFLTNRQVTSDFSVVLVNRPLEGNYFSRPISEKLIVISIFDIESLNIHEGISVEMYIIRFLLAFSTIYKTYNGLSNQAQELMQSNATGCLFDKSIYKPQIAIFFRQPKLSPSVINTLNGKTLPKNFVADLQIEIKKLKIGTYYRLVDWLKENPKKAILITFLIGLIFSELLGNYIYDLIHDHLPFIENAVEQTKKDSL